MFTSVDLRALRVSVVNRSDFRLPANFPVPGASMRPTLRTVVRPVRRPCSTFDRPPDRIRGDGHDISGCDR